LADYGTVVVSKEMPNDSAFPVPSELTFSTLTCSRPDSVASSIVALLAMTALPQSGQALW